MENAVYTTAHAFMSEKLTEGHPLAYLKYVTVATYDPPDCDGIISGLGLTYWMVCLCKLCLSDIKYALLYYNSILFTLGIHVPVQEEFVSVYVFVTMLAATSFVFWPQSKTEFFVIFDAQISLRSRDNAMALFAYHGEP